jgi:hypothetical protein
MHVAGTRTPSEWADVCRSHAAQSLDPVTQIFLTDLAREFEDLASEQSHASEWDVMQSTTAKAAETNVSR